MRTRSRSDRRPDEGPIALPSWLDGISDRWWSLTPRARTLALVVIATSVLAVAVVRSVGSPLGPPTPVLVATGDLAAGTTIDADLVDQVRWPAALVPDAARDVAGGTLRTTLPAGAVLTEAHVTDDGVGGLVDAGRAAVPVPVDVVPAIPIGTRLQVVATAPDGTGRVLADDAEVVASDGTSLWLGVDTGPAADIASAGLRGTIAVAVIPP